MSDQDKLDALCSKSPDARYDAAKYLAAHPLFKNKQRLQVAYDKENVGYIKNTIQIALKRIESNFSPVQNNDITDASVSEDRSMYLRAVSEIAGFFLHELEPIIGRISLSARREINEFDNSQTKRHIGSLKLLLGAITELRQANKSKNSTEFNFENFVESVIANEHSKYSKNINLSGNRGLTTISDKNLLILALNNGIRNAIDSCLLSEREPKIIIRWGETNIDYYLSIIDNGGGLSNSIEELKKIGVSTKKSHFGYGLSILNNAMERIDGHWTLDNNVFGGAILTLRWNK